MSKTQKYRLQNIILPSFSSRSHVGSVCSAFRVRPIDFFFPITATTSPFVGASGAAAEVRRRSVSTVSYNNDDNIMTVVTILSYILYYIIFYGRKISCNFPIDYMRAELLTAHRLRRTTRHIIIM